MASKLNIRQRIGLKLLGQRAKEFIPALTPDGLSFGDSGRISEFRTKSDQLKANVGWCFAANTAIVEPFAAIEIKLYQKKKNGDRQEIVDHPILELIDSPNLALTGEQMRQLHATYMNFTGESYIYMRDGAGPFEPGRGKLPDALDIFPAHRVQFMLGDTYTQSTVKLGQQQYPVTSFIRDINPNPDNPYVGRSVVTASALALDLEDQMKRWNQGVFARGAHPSLIFSTEEELSNEAYERWKEQFDDEHTGTENAHKPLLIENGTAVPYMMNAKDLDFLNSRQFSRDEILAMWRVSPEVIGYTSSSNRATMDAAFTMHAVVNLVPRIRQFVRQLNAAMVTPFDPTLELDFVSPVPDDMDTKLKYAETASGRFLTIDEVRAEFGEPALPDELGTQIYQSNTNASLRDIADGTARPAPGLPNLTPAKSAPVERVKKKI